MQAQQSTLDKIRTRPRFKMYTDLEPTEYEVLLKQYLDQNKEQFSGNINREVATIWVNTAVDSFYKPYLSLRIEKEDEKTVIRGVYGPSSAIWTFFMFLYFGFSILWMVFITMWFVEKQISSNEYPWALTASFVTLGLLALTYLASRFGQSQAKEEMKQLRHFAEKSTLPHERETTPQNAEA